MGNLSKPYHMTMLGNCRRTCDCKTLVHRLCKSSISSVH